MSKRTKLTLWLAVFILGFLLAIPQAKANIPSQPFKVWHDREYLGQLEMQKNVYMDAGLFLQGALINGATGGDPIVVGDHMRVDGILYANNIIVRGASGGDPVIIGDHLRVDGDIFNPYNSVRVKDDFKVSGSSQFSGNLTAKKGVVVTGGNLTVGNSTKFKVECKTGETTISGPLTVTNTSSLKDLTVSGSSSLASLSTSGLATLDSLSVTRSSTFNNSVNVQGNATFTRKVTLGDTAGDKITIIGTPTFSNPISGNVNMTGSLTVGGNLNVTGTSVCDTIIFNNLEVSGVPGTTTLKGPMQFGDAPGDGIDIWGTPTFRTHFTVWNDAVATVFQGDVDINGTLTTGAINTAGTTADIFTIDSDGTAGDVTLVFGAANTESLMWNDAPAAQQFEFSDDVNISDTLAVVGASDFQGDVADSLGDFTIADNFVVTGTSDFQGDVFDSLGDFTIADTLTQSGGGQVAFSGNVDAQSGLDVTNADLTVGGVNFVVDDATGNVTLMANATVDGLDISDLSLTGVGEGASLIGINDAGGYYTSANVEAALQEIASTGGFVNHSLDDAYNDGSSVTVDTTDVVWNLTSTNDFVIQDSGTPFFEARNDGYVYFGGGYGSTGVTIESDGDLLMNGKLTVDGAIDPTSITLTPSAAANAIIVQDAVASNNFIVNEDGSLTLGDGGASNLTVAGATGNLTSAGTVNATTLQQGGVAIDTIYVNEAGDTMSGALNMGAQNITNAGTVTATGFSGPLTGNVTGDVTGNVSGNAGTVTNGVYTTDIGITVQAYDAGLTSIAGLTTAADKMIYTTALDTYAVTGLTATGRAILDDADAAAQRTTLGLAGMAIQGPANVAITGGNIDGTTIGGTTPAAGTFTTLSGSTSLTIGGGTAITKHLSATGSINFASIASQTCGTGTVTVTGAATGDTVVATPTPVASGIDTMALTWSTWVSAADTVTVRACNPTAGALDPANQTWRADVWQH